MTRAAFFLFLILALHFSSIGQLSFNAGTTPDSADCADNIRMHLQTFILCTNYTLDSVVIKINPGPQTVDVNVYWGLPAACISTLTLRDDSITIGQLPQGIWNYQVNSFDTGTYSFGDSTTYDTIGACCPAQADLLTDTAICDGLTLSMADTSTYGTAWWWKENGVTFSTNPLNATRMFAGPGWYNIRLVTGDGICLDSTEMVVGVKEPPTSEPWYETHLNRAYQFYDTSAGNWLPTHSWSFGNGDSSYVQNPAYTFPDTGSFQVCLKIENNCGSDSTCMQVDVNCPLPTANFNYIVDSLDITLTDTSLLANTYFWTHGDGTFTGIKNHSYTYANAGIYTVCLMVTNDCGTDTLCQDINIGNWNGFSERVYDLFLFPNPAGNHVIIEGLSEGTCSARFIDALGRVFPAPFSGNKIYFELPDGVYVLEITDSNERIYRGKVIVRQ
jgi:PKD repeat protein